MSSGLSGPRTSLATGHASLVRMRWAMTYSMGSCITCAFVARVTARAQSRDVTITFLRDPARLLRVLYVWGLSSLCTLLPERVRFGFPFVSTFVSHERSHVCRAVRRGEAGSAVRAWPARCAPKKGSRVWFLNLLFTSSHVSLSTWGWPTSK
jgi:hypothetical protein